MPQGLSVMLCFMMNEGPENTNSLGRLFSVYQEARDVIRENADKVLISLLSLSVLPKAIF